jgi:hypothetical protein
MKDACFRVLAVSLLVTGLVSTAQAVISIESVLDDSPAETAGLRAGDVLLRLDDRPIDTMDDLQAAISAHEPGETVPLVVSRDGKETRLSLTFGERPAGGVSLGARLTVDPSAEPTPGTLKCLQWLDETYRVEAMARDLGVDLGDSYRSILDCVQHDTQRLSSDKAVKFCDPVFKVHCSAIDLLTEIGEAQVARCESLLEASLGIEPAGHASWRTCGQDKVFERYSMKGEASDQASCKAALLDECGTNVEAEIATAETDPAMRGFLDCCLADGLESQEQRGRCGMIDEGFSRGPCHDRSVCVNRSNGEWIHCAVLER